MQIKVLYFAAVREIAGCTEECLVLPPEVETVAALARFIAERFAGLSPYMGSLRFASNEEFVPLECILRNGDVIALIPPVAGG